MNIPNKYVERFLQEGTFDAFWEDDKQENLGAKFS